MSRRWWNALGGAWRTQLWPVPSLCVVLAVALGVALPRLDAHVDEDLPASVTAYLFSGGPEAARTVLSAVAGSLVTVTSLTFSLTVVTLQLASSQHSPRLLRTFTRDRFVHLSLGVPLGTHLCADGPAYGAGVAVGAGGVRAADLGHGGVPARPGQRADPGGVPGTPVRTDPVEWMLRRVHAEPLERRRRLPFHQHHHLTRCDITGQLHLFDPTAGTAEDLGPVSADAGSLAWWPAEDGWHLGYLALTPPVLHAGTAVFDLALDSRGLRNRHPLSTRQRPRRATDRAAAEGHGHPPGAGGHHVRHAATAGLPRRRRPRPGRPARTPGRTDRVRRPVSAGHDRARRPLRPLRRPFPAFWFPSAQGQATAGYAVFLPNPRGGQGHGHQFAASVAGRVGREEWTDILTGIDLLIAQAIADPDRLGIAGGR